MAETDTTSAAAAIERAGQLLEDRSEDLDELQAAQYELRTVRGAAIAEQNQLSYSRRVNLLGGSAEEVVGIDRRLEVVRIQLEQTERLDRELERRARSARELGQIDTAAEEAPRLAQRVAAYRAVQAQLRQLEGELRSVSGQVQRGYQTAAREGRLAELPVVDVETQKDVARIIGAGDYRLPQPKGGPPPGSSPPIDGAGAWGYDEELRKWRPINTDPRGGRRQLSSGPALPRRTR